MKERIKTSDGSHIGVVLDIEDYHRLLRELEELDSIRAYDVAKISGDEVILFAQAVVEIESYSAY